MGRDQRAQAPLQDEIRPSAKSRLNMPKCSSVTTWVVHVVRRRSSWGLAPGSLPLSILEPFWHNLFENPSVPDSWSSPITGDVHWEMLHPIASKDVMRVLKKMKDCVT